MRHGQNKFGWLYLVPLLILVMCGTGAGADLSQTNLAQSSTGVLSGVVMKKAPSQASEPASGIKVVISLQEGRKIKTASTDAEGKYRVILPPGTYRVDVPPISGIGISKDLPAFVTIVGGQGARLDILLDTH